MRLFRSGLVLGLILALSGCSYIYTNATDDEVFFTGIIAKGSSVTYIREKGNTVITINGRVRYPVSEGTKPIKPIKEEENKPVEENKKNKK